MFKLFKWIFRIIDILVLIMTILPIIGLIFMYKDYQPPYDDFESYDELSFNDILNDRLDKFLSGETNSIDFTLTNAEVNSALKDLYATSNPLFGSSDPNVSETDKKYAYKLGDYGGFKGVTVYFINDGLTVEAGVEAGFSGIYYKTTIFLELKLKTEQVMYNDLTQSKYSLEIKNMSLGNLPVLWMYDLSNWVYGLVFKEDLNTTIKNLVSGFGNYDLNTKTIWIYSEDIIKLLGEDNQNKVLLETLFGFIDEAQLIDFELGSNQGGLSFKLNELKSTKSQYTILNSIQNDQDLKNLFTGQLSSVLLSALVPGSKLNFMMHELSLNELIDYYLRDSMIIEQELKIGDVTYKLKAQPIFAELNDDKVYLTIILNFYNEAEPTNIFKTHFTLETTPSIRNNDLVFTVLNILVGDSKSLGTNRIESVLNLLGETDYIESNEIVIKDFLEEFTTQHVTVESVEVENKYLVFEITPDQETTSLLQDLQNEIQNALEDVFTNPQYSNLESTYQDFINNQATLNDLIDTMNDLSPNVQQQLFEDLQNLLGDYSDLIPNL